jgi:hypothetical protein
MSIFSVIGESAGKLVSKVHGDIIIDHIASYVEEHGTEIGLGLALVGGAGAVVTAWKVSPEAHRKLEEKRIELGLDENEHLTPLDYFAACGREVAQVGVSSAVGVGGVVAAHVSHKNTVGKLVTAATLADATLRKYVDAAKETVGEEKAAEIGDKAAQNVTGASVDKDSSALVFTDPRAEFVFVDPFTGMEWTSTPIKVMAAAQQATGLLQSNGDVTLNDFYDFAGGSTCKMGNTWGWDSQNPRPIEVTLDPKFTGDYRIKIGIEYSREPEDIYRKY